MKFQSANALRVIPFVVFLVTAFAQDNSGRTPRKAPGRETVEVIKVGITEYSKIHRTYRNYERLFRELAASARRSESITFDFAVGTYGEVLDWYNKRLIDVAILSAMPMGDLLRAGEANNLQKAYIGDLSVTPYPSPYTLLDLFSDKPKDPFEYRTGCIVLNSDEELKSLDDIKTLWLRGQVKFLFVRPYSLSGYVVPLTILRENGIDPLTRPDQLDFTYEHSKSLKMMIESQAQNGPANQVMHHVAFVLDDTRYEPKQATNDKLSPQIFRKIDIPKLEAYTIPREVVLANYHQQTDDVTESGNKFTKTKNLMDRLFRNWLLRTNNQSLTRSVSNDAPAIRFRSRPTDWERNYEDVRAVLDGTSLPKQLLHKSTLDDLLDDLSKANSPRLALVLSGGGAKCAYQAGAIVEIEKKLIARARDLEEKGEKNAKNLDIKVVVGTSGGAINALLVALGVTKHVQAENVLGGTWQSLKQQQFLQPSGRFKLVFGFCFGLFQALLITVVVLLFGRHTMNWTATIIVLILIGTSEALVALYFQVTKGNIVRLLAIELIALMAIMVIVLFFDRLIKYVEKHLARKRKPRRGSMDAAQTTEANSESSEQNKVAQADEGHWRKLTVLLLIAFGAVEALVAKTPIVGSLIERLTDNHWVDHTWAVALLVSSWSYPYPLAIGCLMAVIGWKIMRRFDWNKWREPLIWWMTILLVFALGLLILEVLFKEGSPSKAGGIDEAFAREIPAVIRSTVDPTFAPSSEDETKVRLGSISERIMANGLMQRDLVITTSKLPVRETTNPLRVNSLPDDLYFYFKSNSDTRLNPPPDKRFIPLKYNKEKLLDVVIGSSTIYPIFPSRTLRNVFPGNEESSSQMIDEMRIIDGGFIHNIPIEAARLWGATHIILIEASPAPQQRDPRDFWDNTVMAFGYLFSQAQRTDTLLQGEEVEAFQLRPTSKCEKLNIKSVCTDDEPDGQPEPDMDTFDFSRRAAERAFAKGREDVKSPKPLFVRVSGAPQFKSVSARSDTILD